MTRLFIFVVLPNLLMKFFFSGRDNDEPTAASDPELTVTPASNSNFIE